MVNRRASDAAAPPAPIAPVVKRKRRASCLGETERRERKRAIDREAQRSLREKTKTHIADLERTIQILRDQDRNGATANLLSEIDTLRAENERLRDVIDGVKSVVGSEIFPRVITAPAGGAGSALKSDDGSPDANGEVQLEQTPRPRANSMAMSMAMAEERSPLPAISSVAGDPISGAPTPISFSHHALVPATPRTVDLDGMNMMGGLDSTSSPSDLGLNFNLDPVFEISEEGNMLQAPDSPATAAFAPFISEIFGSNWRCPSPVVLHIGDAPRSSTPTVNSALCPIWKKSNELFGKVYSYRPGMAALNPELEAGLLYVGIKQGWDTFNEWVQSPALKILKEVDQYLFCHLPRMERLATAYKSFKLLKYYLSATATGLEEVPSWLRPTLSQARTKHPIAVDFFPWPTLRTRLLERHSEIFQTQDLSQCYSHYLKFDWPFSFEDSFFYDEVAQAYYPSPLFERYHRDLKYWTVGERFYDKFPEMRGDIEGDRRRFAEVEG